MGLIIAGVIVMIISIVVTTCLILKTNLDVSMPIVFLSIICFCVGLVMLCAGVDTYGSEQQLQCIKEYVNNPSKYKIIKDVVIEKKN